ncbi:hypothetical protein [Rossellomorea vietnamensis]|uniref:Uncharacterized protein n=1 Tax=Rossellomorea vietnamensis TaxID=218284 RepID=A0A0P6WIH4_9BACI|nr:hypothetical protein [Rossellomorea vietnamensis]KPL61309.1 hypothetical protein AM506_01370 [Rossellomorea vietnamensis]
MRDRRGYEDSGLPDFDDITDHILPAQNNLPLIALGKNSEGKDEPDELSYIEGQKRRNESDEDPRP